MSKDVSVIYSDHARKDLLKLDRVLARKIVLKIKDNSEQDDVLLRAKGLTGVLVGLFRYRIGDYRVIFEVNDGKVVVLTILRIKHRKDVYR